MTLKVLNLRGTNGSGKTYVARKLIEECKAVPYDFNERGKPLVYKGFFNSIPIYFFGSYEANCGGCDTIPSVKIVADLLLKYHENNFGLLFYEGLMISHMIGTVGKAAKEINDDHVMAFLDTPLDVCIERVKLRRKERGDLRPFDPKNVVADYPRVQAARKNALAQGYRVIDIFHWNALDEVKNELRRLVSEIGDAEVLD